MVFRPLRACAGLLAYWLLPAYAVADCAQLPADARVGNAGCLVVRSGAVLMVQQRLSGGWALPGGTAENGERAACTAARETREETGLTVQVQQHLLTLDNGFNIFRCNYTGEQAPAPQDRMEIRGVAWHDARQRAALSWRFDAQRDQIEALMRQQEAAPSTQPTP